jgi:hypothetical protein
MPLPLGAAVAASVPSPRLTAGTLTGEAADKFASMAWQCSN